ncbi:MAG: YicC/YloC family endoribonuclease [Phycisphaeraceae bacterium]
MIRSMTGFGSANEKVDGVHYAVELRSLNNRYFKASIKLPEEIASLEAELDALLRHKLNRGSITLLVKMQGSDASVADQINEAALLTYLDKLESLRTRFAERDQAAHIDLTALLALPGVLQSADDSQILSKARPIILKLAEAACDKALAMRHTEGQTVAEDLAKQRKSIRTHIDIIAERAGGVIGEYHTRLTNRVNSLMATAELKVNENDLIREVAIFAERSDISEEINRMRGHLEQFETIASNPEESVGRTLEFITQEMLREANTISSKSNDAVISRAIVEVKGSIDRIKEQAANVE